MRRLTLILSDLYLPGEAVSAGALPKAIALPGLDRLLRFARPEPLHRDWRAWLARELGCGPIADLQPAHLCALGFRLNPAGSWIATPVQLEARLDHVRLLDRGLKRMLPVHRAAWIAEFARSFGPDLALVDAGEQGFLLQGGPGADIGTVDPARLIDADIGVALPAGSAAALELRKLGTEIEMWLHSSETNALRQRSGLAPVSALWLWGGGAVAHTVLPPEDNAIAARRIHGSDPFVIALGGLARRPGTMTPMPVRPAPASFAELGDVVHAYVQVSPMSGPEPESLHALESNWFKPASAALLQGGLSEFDVIANDVRFRIAPRSHWRFWRPRRSWLESIGHAPATPKA